MFFVKPKNATGKCAYERNPAIMHTHTYYMDMAIEEAQAAAGRGEVPVGAVLVIDGAVVARAHNSVITLHDPSAHAEILALRLAGQKLKNYRFTGASLYVTIEPCFMCAGAMVHARIKQLIFGAYDKKAGGITLFNVFERRGLNHRVKVIPGIREQETARLLQEFFKKKRGGLPRYPYYER